MRAGWLDALKKLAPSAFIKGNPRHGRSRIAFDGEFDVIEFVRLMAKILGEKSHNS
jgi:hypothetical protein